MVTPVVIKLRLRDLAHTGNVVGTVYAVSTAGSIFGTFITGFVLIQWLGTRETVLLVALVLAFLAVAFGDLWRAKVPALVSVGLLMGLGGFSTYSGALVSDCVRESGYYCIRVDDGVKQGRKVKLLRLDRLLHSYASLDDPTFLAYSYEQVLADIATYVAQRDPEFRILFIGGGGYTMPRYVEAVYPESELEVIEIDPEVTRVAFEQLGLRPDTRIVTYNEDARMAVRKLPTGRYDLVVGDAFHDFSVPYHLTTKEFNEQIRALLDDRGLYVVNAIDKLHSGRFLKAYVGTLKQTFPHVDLVRDSAKWDGDDRETYVVVASFQPLSRAVLARATIQAEGKQPVGHFMPEEDFGSWLSAPGSILLTDDYAPVENLMAPIFLTKDNVRKAQARYEAGLAFEHQQRLHDAIDEYDEAIELDPEIAPAYYHRGDAYKRLGEPLRAVEDFGRAIRLDPGYVAAYQMRAATYTALGQPQRAIEDVDAAIKVNPQAGDPYGQRALLHTLLKEDVRARADFERAVELGIDSAVLSKQIDHLKRER